MSDVKERELNMSASELRRGPGWWMDPDGNWNPPEEWPESTPPLPEWVRSADGRWHAPTEAPHLYAVPDQVEPATAAAAPEPTKASLSTNTAAPQPQAQQQRPSAASLSYAAYSKLDPAEIPDEGISLSRALTAGLVAALTAAMIAAGISVLIGVF